MTLTIQSNQGSSISVRAVQQSQRALERALERLSTGQKVPSARYDAAALAVSSRIRGELVSLQKQALNAQQGSAMLQTAEGVYQRTQDMLVRMQSLAAQAQSSNLSATERGMLDTEYQQLKQEITRLTGTQFNGTNLFNSGNFSINSSTSTYGFTVSSSRTADFNGDGIMDIITSATVAGTTSIYLGNGDGSFQSTAAYTLGVGNGSMEIGDFDGDGRTDFAHLSGGNISIYYNDANMGFTNTATFAANGATAYVVGDMDGDGKTDFVTRNAGTITTYLAGSTGSFSSSWTVATALGSSTLSVVDVNNDGKLDVMYRNSGNYQMLINSGSGLSLGGTGTVTNSGSQSFFDVNGDGLQDFIWMNTTNGVNIRLNNGNGNFSTVDYTFNPGFLAVGQTFITDMNGDGIMDIVSATGRYFSYTQGLSNVNFAAQPGGGSINAYFSTPSVTDNTLGIGSLYSVVDLNNDRKLDILRIYSNGSTFVSRHMNQSVIGLEGSIRVGNTAATRDNVSFRMGSIALNSLDSQLGYSMINSIGSAKRAEQSILRAITSIIYFRTSVGATINRLEKVQDNISTMIENQEGARSAIADLDVAEEMASFTNQKIVLQAGISMVAQSSKTQRLVATLLEKGGLN